MREYFATLLHALPGFTMEILDLTTHHAEPVTGDVRAQLELAAAAPG